MDDIKSMDAGEEEEGGWAGHHEEVDYSKEVVFSDSSDEEGSPKKSRLGKISPAGGGRDKPGSDMKEPGSKSSGTTPATERVKTPDKPHGDAGGDDRNWKKKRDRDRVERRPDGDVVQGRPGNSPYHPYQQQRPGPLPYPPQYPPNYNRGGNFGAYPPPPPPPPHQYPPHQYPPMQHMGGGAPGGAGNRYPPGGGGASMHRGNLKKNYGDRDDYHRVHDKDQRGPKRKWEEPREPRASSLGKDRIKSPSPQLETRTDAKNEIKSETPPILSDPPLPVQRVSSLSSDNQDEKVKGHVTFADEVEELEDDGLSSHPQRRGNQPKLMLRKFGEKEEGGEGRLDGKDKAGDGKGRSGMGRGADEDASGSEANKSRMAWSVSERGPIISPKTLYEPEGKRSADKFKKYHAHIQDPPRVGGGGEAQRHHGSAGPDVGKGGDGQIGRSTPVDEEGETLKSPTDRKEKKDKEKPMELKKKQAHGLSEDARKPDHTRRGSEEDRQHDDGKKVIDNEKKKSVDSEKETPSSSQVPSDQGGGAGQETGQRHGSNRDKPHHRKEDVRRNRIGSDNKKGDGPTRTDNRQGEGSGRRGKDINRRDSGESGSRSGGGSQHHQQDKRPAEQRGRDDNRGSRDNRGRDDRGREDRNKEDRGRRKEQDPSHYDRRQAHREDKSSGELKGENRAGGDRANKDADRPSKDVDKQHRSGDQPGSGRVGEHSNRRGDHQGRGGDHSNKGNERSHRRNEHQGRGGDHSGKNADHAGKGSEHQAKAGGDRGPGRRSSDHDSKEVGSDSRQDHKHHDRDRGRGGQGSRGRGNRQDDNKRHERGPKDRNQAREDWGRNNQEGRKVDSPGDSKPAKTQSGLGYSELENVSSEEEEVGFSRQRNEGGGAKEKPDRSGYDRGSHSGSRPRKVEEKGRQRGGGEGKGVGKGGNDHRPPRMDQSREPQSSGANRKGSAKQRDDRRRGGDRKGEGRDEVAKDSSGPGKGDRNYGSGREKRENEKSGSQSRSARHLESKPLSASAATEDVESTQTEPHNPIKNYDLNSYKIAIVDDINIHDNGAPEDWAAPIDNEEFVEVTSKKAQKVKQRKEKEEQKKEEEKRLEEQKKRKKKKPAAQNSSTDRSTTSNASRGLSVWGAVDNKTEDTWNAAPGSHLKPVQQNQSSAWVPSALPASSFSITSGTGSVGGVVSESGKLVRRDSGLGTSEGDAKAAVPHTAELVTNSTSASDLMYNYNLFDSYHPNHFGPFAPVAATTSSNLLDQAVDLTIGSASSPRSVVPRESSLDNMLADFNTNSTGLTTELIDSQPGKGIGEGLLMTPTDVVPMPPRMKPVGRGRGATRGVGGERKRGKGDKDQAMPTSKVTLFMLIILLL